MVNQPQSCIYIYVSIDGGHISSKVLEADMQQVHYFTELKSCQLYNVQRNLGNGLSYHSMLPFMTTGV